MPGAPSYCFTIKRLEPLTIAAGIAIWSVCGPLCILDAILACPALTWAIERREPRFTDLVSRIGLPAVGESASTNQS